MTSLGLLATVALCPSSGQ
jgi:Protein of unknown function (DUF3622)